MKNGKVLSSKARILNIKEVVNAYKEINGLSSGERTYIETFEVCNKLFNELDRNTKKHSINVAQYSTAIGKKMNLPQKGIINLKIGALMHDIGKILIEDSILNKPDKLTEEEFAIIKNHTMIGYELVHNINLFDESKKIIIQHHERIDGRGYPYGVKNKEIDLLARIVSVADSYEAMIGKRVYKRTQMTPKDAMDELIRCKGTQFDQEVVNIFVEILKNHDLNMFDQICV